MNSRQAARTCPSHEAEQERFGLIVKRVADRDQISFQAIRGRMQEPITQLPGHVFDRAARLPRRLTHILAAHLDRHTECRGKLAAKGFVGVRFATTQLVIEVRHAGHRDVTVALQIQEQMQQRN